MTCRGSQVQVLYRPPAQKFPTPLRFPPVGGKLRYVGNFFAFRARFASLDSGPRGTGDAGWDLSFFVYDFFAFRRGPLRWVRGGDETGDAGLGAASFLSRIHIIYEISALDLLTEAPPCQVDNTEKPAASVSRLSWGSFAAPLLQSFYPSIFRKILRKIFRRELLPARSLFPPAYRAKVENPHEPVYPLSITHNPLLQLWS